MTKQSEQTEVVKIRLGSEDKVRLQEIAETECRTFSDQCRLAIWEWLKTKSARPGRGAAAKHCGNGQHSIQHLHGGEYAQMPKRHFTMQETLHNIFALWKLIGRGARKEKA